MRVLPVGVALALVSAACNEPVPAIQGQRRALAATAWSRLLGPGQVTVEPARPERPAQGPSAVAVAPDGAALVLDRLGRRVLRVTARSQQVLATVPPWAEDLAAATDGAFALYSPLLARVWIRDAEGGALGELRVPRILRAVRGIALGASRQVWLQDAHQQRYLLGGPSVLQPLEAVLHSQQPGANALASGDGVQARLAADRVPELWVVRGGAERDRVVRVHRLDGPALSARVVGTSGDLACLLVERRAAAEGFVVAREAVCLDTGSGALHLRVALPPPGAYPPRRELSLGGTPPRLAHIGPEGDGLRVSVWPVGPEGRAVR